MNKGLKMLKMLWCCLGLSSLLHAEIPLKPMISQLDSSIVESAFDQDTERMRKGMLGKWKVGIGEWRIEEGRLIGDELPENNHASSLTHHFEAEGIVISAKIRLGTAKNIVFACRDNVPPKNHLGRLFIMDHKMWITHMSGLGKTTKNIKLVTEKVTLDRNKWYDVTIEIIGDRYHAQVGEHKIEATHPRYKDTKGIVALVNKGQGAEFKDVSIWHAKAK